MRCVFSGLGFSSFHPQIPLRYYTSGDGGFLRDARAGRGGLPAGAPTRDEFLRTYFAARGIAPPPRKEWRFWVALNCFRTAAIVHGVFARYVGGNAGSTNAAYAGGAFVDEVEKGLRLLRKEEEGKEEEEEEEQEEAAAFAAAKL